MADEEPDRLTEKLSPRQKVRLLTGGTTWRTRAEPAVGLTEVVTSDGPAGVRGEAWDERITSVLLPSASALAASWDEQLVAEVGELLAQEARRKGVQVVLAPNLNLHRSPLAGRHFECFSEDPWLVGRVGAALVRGLQSQGVAATAKHFVANDSETGRLTMDVRVDERTLREVCLAPFEAAVDAGVWAVMAGYNRVNGTTLTASPLLARPLKEEWGFDGVVLSDWGALRTAVDTANAALDLAMPGPGGPWDEALAEALAAGQVPQAAIDDKVRRLLLLAQRVGALDGGPASLRRTAPDPSLGRRLLRRAAAAGTVLLDNDGVLPLRAAELSTVAVIGAHAVAPRVQGGGSAGVFPERVVSPLDGIREWLRGRARVVHAAGPDLGAPPVPLDPRNCTDPRSGEPGVLLRLLDADGDELYGEHRRSGRLLEPALRDGAHTVEISALLTPDTGGRWSFGLGGFGRMSLFVDGHRLIDGTFPRATDDPAVVHVQPPGPTAHHTLTAGTPVLVVARRELAPDTGRATVLTAAPPAPPVDTALAEAVAAARSADVAIVVVGTTDGSEAEGHDRTSLALPGHQDDLVRAVAAAAPRTVVVVNSGGPVELPWRSSVGAVLLTWLPGQEAGGALADILFGFVEPGGRLPTTWAGRLDDAPVTATRPVDGVLAYDEGLHVGHRAWLRAGRTPAYWFGHGLGYTTWRYESVDVPEIVSTAREFTVTVRMRNTGERAGREIVQVYLSRPDSEVERPVRWLAGYAAVRAVPGETVVADVTVDGRSLRHWSVEEGNWAAEPGRFTVHVGRSAGDLPLTAPVEVQVREAGRSGGHGQESALCAVTRHD
ncbi:glycoside hydrolase family 3 C-terminal domain-containing protein [Streptomyces kunmingensis]|uniref:Glycoside hydrolase family 3 C-terminal domain-containing protein n=1 Tax=Streptomyces kunmingensis TaxID=68225 RepID=A0ABU6CDZ5_9ACTN|nr:glycoside hydrolase family 3 C-terminal domain-containing protein [Streptomyces kunmingensis]MEB3962935.1 glycoside hydrolase family 3 C-terminal domain-containing protein [Streptomyces kunmingensis]